MHPITAVALDKILAFLAPLFLQQADGNLQAARQAASHTLAGYAARSDQEVRLAALIISFSYRALDALSRAAAPDLDTKTVLRLNGSANALNRAAQQCQRTFDRLRRNPVEDAPGAAVMVPADLPLMASATERLAFMQTAPGQPGTSTVPVAEDAPSPNAALPADGLAPDLMSLSRPQRRAALRQAEKTLRRQQEADRLAARAATIAAQARARRRKLPAAA